MTSRIHVRVVSLELHGGRGSVADRSVVTRAQAGSIPVVHPIWVWVRGWPPALGAGDAGSSPATQTDGLRATEHSDALQATHDRFDSGAVHRRPALSSERPFRDGGTCLRAGGSEAGTWGRRPVGRRCFRTAETRVRLPSTPPVSKRWFESSPRFNYVGVV